jgi:hypothetical protein
MKFGFESEKLLFDLKDNSIFHGVFQLVDALSDYALLHGDDIPKKVTNEFVLNMVEMNTLASTSQREVIEDYLLLYQLVNDVSLREKVSPLPLAAVPFQFTPNMAPKWAYYVQNSILSGKRPRSWQLSPNSPLADAGNCAGLHAHFEIECLPEFLFFTKELVHKHNAALMLAPMVAFAASPYFYDTHTAHSMRSSRYYLGVYEKFQLNGRLPPVMETSEEVLRYTLAGMEYWVRAGVSVGFARHDMENLVAKKGANWSMVRWNRRWNTIELRCLESDRIDYDVSKFVWAAGAMRRFDWKGEALEPEPLQSTAPLDGHMIADVWRVSGKTVSILSTAAIHDLTTRAIKNGVEDPFVEAYLHRLADFAEPGVDDDCVPVFNILKHALAAGTSTSEVILRWTRHAAHVTQEQCVPIIKDLVDQERAAIAALREEFPTVIRKHRSELFPMVPRGRFESQV